MVWIDPFSKENPGNSTDLTFQNLSVPYTIEKEDETFLRTRNNLYQSPDEHKWISIYTSISQPTEIIDSPKKTKQKGESLLSIIMNRTLHFRLGHCIQSNHKNHWEKDRWDILRVYSLSIGSNPQPPRDTTTWRPSFLELLSQTGETRYQTPKHLYLARRGTKKDILRFREFRFFLLPLFRKFLPLMFDRILDMCLRDPYLGLLYFCLRFEMTLAPCQLRFHSRTRSRTPDIFIKIPCSFPEPFRRITPIRSTFSLSTIPIIKQSLREGSPFENSRDTLNSRQPVKRSYKSGQVIPGKGGHSLTDPRHPIRIRGWQRKNNKTNTFTSK